MTCHIVTQTPNVSTPEVVVGTFLRLADAVRFAQDQSDGYGYEKKPSPSIFYVYEACTVADSPFVWSISTYRNGEMDSYVEFDEGEVTIEMFDCVTGMRLDPSKNVRVRTSCGDVTIFKV